MTPRPLTDVKGVGEKTAAHLAARGIDSADALAAAPIADIAACPGFGLARATAVRRAAAALVAESSPSHPPTETKDMSKKKDKAEKKDKPKKNKAEKGKAKKDKKGKAKKGKAKKDKKGKARKDKPGKKGKAKKDKKGKAKKGKGKKKSKK